MAYGTKDQRFKYKAAGRYFHIEKPTSDHSLSASKMTLNNLAKVRMLGERTTFFHLFSEGRLSGSMLMKNIKAGYEIEYFPGFSTKFEFAPKGHVWSVGDVLVSKQPPQTGVLMTSIALSTARIRTSVQDLPIEKSSLVVTLDRISMGTKYPVFEVNARARNKRFPRW